MTPPLPLVQRKQRQARQRIIEAARELFLERGFDGVSVGDIAERAEVGRTTFFRHFGDKQEVVFGKEQELLDAIQVAVERDRVRRREDSAVAELRARFGSLTVREREVFALVVTGRPNKQIAAELDLSEMTVKVHRSQITRKMQAKSIVALVRMADKLGVSAPGA